MRILLRGAYVPAYGGVSVHVKRLKQALTGRGLAVDLATYPAPSKNTMIDGADYRLLYPQVLAKIIRGQYNLVHVHTSGVSARELARFVSFRGGGAKLVLSLHSYREPRARQSQKYKTAVYILLKAMHHIICINPTIRDKVVASGASPDKTSVISPYLPPALLEQDRTAIPESLRRFMHTHRPLLTANAFRLNWYNGHDLYGLDLCVQLCHALVQEYPKLGFVFALPTVGDETYFAQIKAKIAGLKLDNVFTFFHAPAEYWPILEQSDLFLRPTNTDGFSISVAEAIDLGIPAIASNAAPRPPETILFHNRDFSDLLAKTRGVQANLDSYKKKLASLPTHREDPVSQIMGIYRQVTGSTGKIQ